jgi:hypothetical protein
MSCARRTTANTRGSSKSQRVFRTLGPTVKRGALYRFMTLPLHVRLLWFLAAFQMLAIASKALGS